MIPEILKTSASSENPYFGYKVNYLKVNLDDDEERERLERIETQALDPKGTVLVLSYEKFSFQDSFYIVAKYLTKT